jgi:predicted polyphosphate/ATP-dependent NAD kinase
VAELALAKGAKPQAIERTRMALEGLLPWQQDIEIVTAAGAMGGDIAQSLGFVTRIIHTPRQPEAALLTTAQDTQQAAQALQAANIDLLLFAGGDGTARDIAALQKLCGF